MSDSQSSNGSGARSWIERLSQVLSGEPKDRQELLELLQEAGQRNVLDSDALGMIEGALQVADMQVRDIMVPRAQMVVVGRDQTIAEMLPVITESAHSRFPVVGDSRDDVVGILLAKDLLPYFQGGAQDVFNVRELLRPAVFVPESKRLNILLKEFRTNQNHMAIVVDEYGGVAGLVTIEDVLEQIVGDISDEHDLDEDAYFKKHSDTEYIVKALTPVDEFNEQFYTSFDEEEFDTIGGVVINAFGHLPKRGDTLTIGPISFRVLAADSRRLHLLQISLTPELMEKVSQAKQQPDIA